MAASTLGARVETRLHELKKWGTLKQIMRESGVSDVTWKKLIEQGISPRRKDVLVKMADYLEWSVEGLAVAAEGGTPEDLRQQPESVGGATFEEVVAAVNGLTTEVRQLRSDLLDRLNELAELSRRDN